MAASQGFNLTRLALTYVLITIWRRSIYRDKLSDLCSTTR
jgi:hypothetical protein